MTGMVQKEFLSAAPFLVCVCRCWWQEKTCSSKCCGSHTRRSLLRQVSAGSPLSSILAGGEMTHEKTVKGNEKGLDRDIQSSFGVV